MARILVIDPVARNRVEIVTVLGGAGHEVTTVANGREAFGVMDEVDPDLVLSELQTPVMNGLAFLEHFRSNPRYDSVPVIVLTDLADGVSFRRARQLGANKYLIRRQATHADLLRHVGHQLQLAVMPRRVLPPVVEGPILDVPASDAVRADPFA